MSADDALRFLLLDERVDRLIVSKKTLTYNVAEVLSTIRRIKLGDVKEDLDSDGEESSRVNGTDIDTNQQRSFSSTMRHLVEETLIDLNTLMTEAPATCPLVNSIPFSAMKVQQVVSDFLAQPDATIDAWATEVVAVGCSNDLPEALLWASVNKTTVSAIDAVLHLLQTVQSIVRSCEYTHKALKEMVLCDAAVVFSTVGL
jgi:hypothetical protein